MIPTNVCEYLDSLKSQVKRQDLSLALSGLSDLGIEKDTQFAKFYSKYQGPFTSPRPIEELLDIGVPTNEIMQQSEYVCDSFDIPNSFICLTTTESEGFFLYDKKTEAVYDVNYQDIDDFLSNKLPPKWKDFNDFLEWYFID